MMRALRILILSSMLCAAVLGAAGCTSRPAKPPAAKSGMGMSSGSSGSSMSRGAIATADNASMAVPSFEASSGVIRVPSVVAPDNGWVIVRSSEPSGGVLGYAPVTKGANKDIALTLAAIDGRQVLILLLVDRGAKRRLDYSAVRPAATLDKPVIVDGKPVEYEVILNGWGAETNPSSALVLAEVQPASAVLDVGYLLVPGPSWVEVRRLDKGVPTERLGLLQRPAGEFHKVPVPMKGARSGDEIVITVLADRGTPGVFEPATRNALLGVDQPWVQGGAVVTQRLRLE